MRSEKEVHKAIKADLKSDGVYYKQKRKYYKKHKEAVAAVAAELNLPDNAVIRATCNSYEIHLCVSGGPDTLREVFRTFRKLGYEPTRRPGIKPEAVFTTRFAQPEDNKEILPEFYLNFSSLACKRVKIGVEMVERPIYDVVCE